eukprot:EST45263.1 Hypothetical protein SS50377_14839 [Spironucleus salmonicida]
MNTISAYQLPLLLLPLGLQHTQNHQSYAIKSQKILSTARQNLSSFAQDLSIIEKQVSLVDDIKDDITLSLIFSDSESDPYEQLGKITMLTNNIKDQSLLVHIYTDKAARLCTKIDFVHRLQDKLFKKQKNMGIW